MITNNTNRGAVVGLFISIGLVILLVAIFTLGGQQKAFTSSITVTAEFDDVSGLQQGNNVWFSGVKIGTVKKISIAGNSQVRVIMHIDEKAQEFIRKNTNARISTDGLIGNKIVVLYGGTPSSPSIENNDTLKVERTLNTDDMMATLQKNNDNLYAITSDFKLISKRIAGGEGTVGLLLSDKSIFNNLAKTMTNLQLASQNSQRLTGSINAYIEKLQTPGTLAGSLVSDTTIISSLKRSVAKFELALASTDSFTQQLKTMGRQLNDPDNMVGVLLRDKQSADRLKNTIINLNEGSIKLNEDLEAAQHNFLLRGYFKNKDKEAEKEAARQVDSMKKAQKGQ